MPIGLLHLAATVRRINESPDRGNSVEFALSQTVARSCDPWQCGIQSKKL
jgi:hypothetical protein